ncbi:5-hydroxytryptamine receptor 2A [Trichonephila clavipes]|uniref:5-hydroxytryptamine receptor 2A n=1 Tax=Trichonephila clavipes TaxID=2585209 RepID=A0A8X6VTQ2_TRICX|nr:5-hydroxytryptamine receptor 2A [Trichonephila clavipes]
MLLHVYYTLSIVLVRKAWWGKSLPQPKTRYFERVTDQKTVLAGVTIEFPVFRGRSEHNGQHVILHYLVGRGRLAGLKDKSQPSDVRCQKCTDLLSNFRPSEVEMCVSLTQWLAKPSQLVLGCYGSNEYKQVTSGPPGASKPVDAIRILHAEPGLM